MPQATQHARLALRVGILSVLSASLLGGFTGVAAADTSPSSGGPTQSPSSGGSSGTADPGQSSTSPSDPSASSSGTSESSASTGAPTSTASPNRTVTVRMRNTAASRRAAHMRSMRAQHHMEVRAVLREAWRQRGKPYVYGAAGPRAFDCSGLVRYVFGHAVGRWLPHNAAAQYHSIMHIKRRDLQPGDLVFQESGGYPYHVGIYAGHGKWWDAPHSGDHVRKQPIYHGRKYYGRVLTNGFANRHTHRRHHKH